MTIRALVFTDLDGTLLDHHTYQPGPAEAALHRLIAAGALVVFCSAKTLSEQRHVAAQMGVDVGFITENGAQAVMAGVGAEKRFGVSYEEVRRKLAESLAILGVEARGYGDLTAEQVAEATGLPIEQAALAKERCCTETIVDLDDSLAPRLDELLNKRGLRLQEGARFWSVQGRHDKGQAIRWMVDRLSVDGQWHTFGIGDGPNDVQLLEVVEERFLVQKPGGSWAELHVDGVNRLSGVGPLGWVSAAEIVLDWVNRR